MGKVSATLVSAVLLAATGLGGCSSDGGILGSSLSTQSIGLTPAASTTTGSIATANKIDPACYTLTQRIDSLRSDGLTERLEKAAIGKSGTVQVKRTSLAQAAELDRLNAEFQAKCSTIPRPAQTATQLAPSAPSTVPANSAQVVSANAPAVAPPVVVQQQPAR